ncbi:MAG: hypothetical protein IPJ18_04785 [Betaproteobacteria bacterium]|nr:hypothetical protein [Betaproteobacteria bacterium]
MLAGTCGSAYLVRIGANEEALANVISIWSITLMSSGTFFIIPWLSQSFKILSTAIVLLKLLVFIHILFIYAIFQPLF